MSTAADTVTSRSNSERLLAWSMRLFGGIDLLALAPFLMPIDWLRAGHELCGMGPFPEGPIPEYLARATSLLWAVHGAVLLYLSFDVRRHANVIRFVAWLTVLAGVCLLGLGLRTDLPWWWIALEGPVFTATGLWYAWCLRRLPDSVTE